MKKDKLHWTTLIQDVYAQKSETNEIDFKEDLSENAERLKEHINGFANSDDGGVFVFGVTRRFKLAVQQPDHEEISTKITNLAKDTQSPSLSIEIFFVTLEGSQLLAVYIHPGTNKPVFIKDRSPLGGSACFKRSGANTIGMSDSEIRDRLARSTHYFYDETGVDHASLDDLDYGLIEESIKGFKFQDRWTDSNLLSLLDNKILCGTPRDYQITVAGLLVFGKEPQAHRQFKNAVIEFQQFRSSTREEPIKKSIISGSLPTQIQSAISLMLQHVWVMPNIQGSKRQEMPSYNEEILREVITNSLVHRDYKKMHQPVKIALFKDRFEIENPGSLLPGLTTLNLIHKREWRNPAMAELLAKFKLGDMDGQGIDRLYAATRLIKVPAPIFIDTQSTFKAILSGPKIFDDFSPEEKRLTVLVLLIMEDTIDNESLRNTFGIDAARATTLLKALIEDHMVIGTTTSRKFAKYRLTETYRQKVFG